MLIEYIFQFEDGRELRYPVSIDTGSMTLLEVPGETFPAWVRLEYHQCKNCPLDSESHPDCPVAKNLYHLVESTKNDISCNRSKVTVITSERRYEKETDLQTGLFSLMGLLMAVSACPHFAVFKPLARFHLPFSTVKETLYRTCGNYLLEGYLKNELTELNLDGLNRNYCELGQVNAGIIDRINSVSEGDADRNALVALDIFAKMFGLEYQTNFSSLNDLFDN